MAARAWFDAAPPESLIMTTLFDSLRLGPLDLPNRILMATVTQARGAVVHIPTDMMVDYYRQRASTGLSQLANGFNRFLASLQPVIGDIQQASRDTGNSRTPPGNQRSSARGPAGADHP